MKLKTVFIRFYKSFNYDYLRKFHSHAHESPWEIIDNQWYPYVRIPIDPKVTTIVGANESGKTQLLTAIEAGICGEGIRREDFCRYSQFFTVETGKLKLPDFGFEWDNLSEADQRNLRGLSNIPETLSFNEFLFFRTNGNQIKLFIPTGSEYKEYDLKSEKSAKLVNICQQSSESIQMLGTK
jgi:AAA15 family ATPase/GTPase